MAKFVFGSQTDATSDEPTLEIVIDPAKPMKVGKYVFRLVVTDDAGNDSDPQDIIISVLDKDRPTAVITLINAQGERINTPSVEIPFGQKFMLTGDKSTDIGGNVVKYQWTLLQ